MVYDYHPLGKRKVALVRVLLDGNFQSLVSLDPEPIVGTVALILPVLETGLGPLADRHPIVVTPQVLVVTT